ncbi:unnamed protein product [Staurois parvus]|uniref:Uncharacterized protein n=1 Tax=Staurois parvus TaxID=386267 RepID=A0ABN9BUM3_9NEOB|nr:unnamed protein product [Staurois parvus]
MYVKWFDTVMFYYVILVNLVNVTFCHFQISRRSVPVRPDAPRGQNPDADAGICWRTLQGTLQEGHRGSAGQGKRRTDPRAAPHGKPECSLGVTACATLGIPPGRLR